MNVILTTTGNNACCNDDEADDNMSDEDEWLEKTKNIACQCPSIFHNGIYHEPIDFHTNHVDYGDGGSKTLKYPIWICGGLSRAVSDLESDVRVELLKVFYALNDRRKDFHKYPSPVEDIIDPDLLVCKPIEPPLSPLPPSPSSDSNDDDDDNDDYSHNYWNYDPSTLRGSYQWIPSEFRLCRSDNADWQVHIETPISHLPMTEEYAQTYRHLEKVFGKLVPMFNRIIYFNKDNDNIRLQVIVKVQNYNIQPGTKYSGRWHTEGYTENIQAVGVYYLYIDDELEGGALKFRPSETPSKYYAEGACIEINRYVMPETDAAIVFDNSLPHRFCSIRNSTSIARRRTFLNFFVVNPFSPIHALSICNLPLVSYEQCLMLLKSIENDHHQQKLPDLAIENILRFLKDNIWETDTDAKEFRARVKHEMVNEKSGWSGICHGNSGDIVFIKSNNDWKIRTQQYGYRDLSSHLEHTESD